MNSEATFRSDFDVKLIAWMGDDELICKAARVSTQGAASIDSDEAYGLIKFLMNNRHGTPFEHNSMTFMISAPIFVWREFMRHRIGFSYNEQSGRYMEMLPVFYIPPPERNLIQVGKAGAYTFEPGNDKQYDAMMCVQQASCKAAWASYKGQLNIGIAKEVARMVLPVSIYSTAYVTCNTRSLMSFLSLRTKEENTMFPSFPMWEINQVATKMESLFSELFPLTHTAFQGARRVAP